MNFKTIALATAFALSSTFALAQAGGAGAEVPEKSGAATNAQGGVVGTTTNRTTMSNGTSGTGMASSMLSGRESKEKMANGTSSGSDEIIQKHKKAVGTFQRHLLCCGSNGCVVVG